MTDPMSENYDLPLTLDLALVIAQLKLVERNVEVLSELGDIKEQRRLAAQLEVTQVKLQDQGLIPEDPLEYCRVHAVGWASDAFQFLDEAQNLIKPSKLRWGVQVESRLKSGKTLGQYEGDLQAFISGFRETLSSLKGDLQLEFFATEKNRTDVQALSGYLSLLGASEAMPSDAWNEVDNILKAESADSAVLEELFSDLHKALEIARTHLQKEQEQSHSLAEAQASIGRGDYEPAEAIARVPESERYSDTRFFEIESAIAERDKLLSRIESAPHNTERIKRIGDALYELHAEKWPENNPLKQKLLADKARYQKSHNKLRVLIGALVMAILGFTAYLIIKDNRQRAREKAEAAAEEVRLIAEQDEALAQGHMWVFGAVAERAIELREDVNKPASDYSGWAKEISDVGSITRLSYYENGEMNGFSVSFHTNMVKHLVGNYNRGKEDGLWTAYDLSGNKQSEKSYEDGALNGTYSSWYSNGQKRLLGNYKENKREGVWTAWADDGAKLTEEIYSGGILDGAYSLWHPNGQLKLKGSFSNGEKDGLWIDWSESGTKLKEENYNCGVLNGASSNWHESGHLAEKGTFKHGKKESAWTEWNKEGVKLFVSHYAQGILNGPWTEWHCNGNEKLKGLYMDGQAEGLWLEYSENGDLLDETYYTQGKEDFEKCYEVGMALASVQASNEDLIRSVRLFKKASEAAHDEARYELARAYFYGRGVQRDLKAASNLWRILAEEGHVPSKIDLGFYYYIQAVDDYDLCSVRKAYQLVSGKECVNNGVAQYILGWCHQRGLDLDVDENAAQSAWTKAARLLSLADKRVGGLNDPASLFILGVMHQLGRGGFSVSPSKAMEYYLKVAGRGFPSAEYSIGVLYRKGGGLEENPVKAAEWFGKAAEQGDASAQVMLGTFYFNGYGVEKNSIKAVEWFRKAAEPGNAEAQEALSMCYFRGDGVEKDPLKGIAWLTKAAEKGDADLKLALSTIYIEGRYGVEKDPGKGVVWLKKAAEEGAANAQVFMAQCYFEGLGVDKDPDKEVMWLKKAADQGNADAFSELGYCYYHGRGVPKSENTAFKYWQKAASQGHADGTWRYGFCYAWGTGVQMDAGKAVKLWNQAAKLGSREAKEALKKLDRE